MTDARLSRPASDQPVEALGAGREEIARVIRDRAQIGGTDWQRNARGADINAEELADLIAALSPASPARTPHVDATGHEYSPDGSGHCRHCGAEGPRLTARREAAKAERERSIEREAAAEARDLPPAHVEGDRGDPGVNGGETTRLNGAGQDGREGNPPQRANPMMTHVLSVVPCEPTEEMLKALEDADIFQSRETTSMIWRAMIAALSPASPARPELTVWYGKMPESNGRENWTALLRRVNPTDKWDQGFCFARSEYPGRVLYEADRVRWIIGERAERPDILAYDADAHSGYVEPASPARTPMGDAGEPVAWPETLDWSTVETEALCHLRASFGDYVLDVVQGQNRDWSYRVNHTGRMGFERLESATAAAMEDLTGRLKRRWSEAKETMRLYAAPTPMGGEVEALREAVEKIASEEEPELGNGNTNDLLARQFWTIATEALAPPSVQPVEGK